MKKLFQLSLLATLILGLSSCNKDALKPLKTVPAVDISRYVGKWYEIGSIPQFFNNGCNCTTAEYSINADGTVKVVNRCELARPGGKENLIEGKARVVKNSNNSKLEVKFAVSPWAPYWIIELGADYEYAVVSDPARGTLFVLSRTPQIDEAVYNDLLNKAKNQGLNIGRVKRTAQGEGCTYN